MAQISNGHDYYKKMLDLQDKLRKSEEERIRLEERFKILVQESRNRHDACINRLRLRYIEFLEEQRARDERNHKLLGTLDRVDSSLALMTAKTDRLNILRKHYEASLLRAYANRNLPGSTTGDSGIASQNDDRWSKRNISTGQVHWISPEVKSISSSMIRVDHPAEHASLIKLNPSTDQPLLDSAPLITQSDSILQSSPQRNGVLPYTTGTSRKSQKYSFSQDPSSNAYRSVYKSPARVRADENQYGPSGAASIVEATPLSHQSVPRNVSQSVQMESVQASPRLLLPGSLNANVSQYKLHDVSSSVSPGFPSSMVQSLQFPSNKITTPYSRQTPGNTDLPNDFRMSNKTPLNGSSIQGSYQEDPRDVRRSFRELGVHSLTTAEIDEIMRRDEPRNRIATRTLQNFTPLVKKSISAGKEDGATANLENQLDRYIHKIRMTQREHDIRSLEEPDHEQNTSGDLLNVSLSDDDLDLPAEAKSKEKLPEEVERVLALADDLASRSLLEDGEIKYPEVRNEESIEDRSVRSFAQEGQPGSPDLAKDAISNDTVQHVPELDSQGNIEQPAKQGLVDLDAAKSASEQGDDSASSQVQKKSQPSKKEDDSISPKIIKEEIEVDREIHAGEESELKVQWTQELEELAPWDLKRIEKRVEEINLSDDDKDQSTEKDIVTEDSSAHDSSGEQLGVLDLLDSAPKKLDNDQSAGQKHEPHSKKPEEQDNTEVVNIGKESEGELKLENDAEEQGATQSEIKSNDPTNTQHTEDNKSIIQKNDDSEVNQVKVENIEQQENVNQNEEQYAEVPNESQEYQQDYDYESAGYETNVDQTYQEYGNQQYVEGVNDQFDKYSDQQYVQYEQDPNAQYDQDPNAQYQDYNYEQQYDPNQTYEDQNQAYEYSGDIPYDANAENVGTEEGDVQNQQDNKILSGLEGNEKNNEETVQEVHERNPDNEQSQMQEQTEETSAPKKKRDVIKSLLDSDTESTIERNVSITESDMDFN